MMLRVAAGFPEWSGPAKRVRISEVSATTYYGSGYQDMVNRRPNIDTTCRDLDWRPSIGMRDSLIRLFDFYRGQLGTAGDLLNGRTWRIRSGTPSIPHQRRPG